MRKCIRLPRHCVGTLLGILNGFGDFGAEPQPRVRLWGTGFPRPIKDPARVTQLFGVCEVIIHDVLSHSFSTSYGGGSRLGDASGGLFLQDASPGWGRGPETASAWAGKRAPRRHPTRRQTARRWPGRLWLASGSKRLRIASGPSNPGIAGQNRANGS